MKIVFGFLKYIVSNIRFDAGFFTKIVQMRQNVYAWNDFSRSHANQRAKVILQKTKSYAHVGT